MITKDDILRKCQSVPKLQGLVKVIESRDFTEPELEAIDFIVETHRSMRDLIRDLNEVLINKLEIWLASTKDTD